MTKMTHVFETAGLGVAPFRFVRSYESKYQACPGAPVQPGSSCDFCATAIMTVCVILSADGREFKVGCDCVEKTGDAGLRRFVTEIQREKRAAATRRRNAKADDRIAAARELLSRDDIRARLSAEPHPLKWQADKGATRLDWAEWMMANAGRSGRLDVAKALEAVAA